MMEKAMNRLIAHIIFQTKTALKVGSNNNDFLQDSPIQRDWNELPMILGTSLAGILRKNFAQEIADDIFGKDFGSKIIFSNALILDENHKVCESLCLEKSEFLQNFIVLPIREHTAITHKGVSKEHSKYDEEVVHKGARFKFRIEMLCEKEKDKESFFQALDLLSDESLRIGSGSTKGRGEIEVLEITYGEYNINSQDYENLTSSLNESLPQTYTAKTQENPNYTLYKLTLKPDDFFIFGSGGGDDDADNIGVRENIIDYDKKELIKNKLLIPASSIKGALSHRTTFYYNKLCGNFIENSQENKVEYVKEIFGAKKDKDTEATKGKIILSDLYKDSIKDNQKTFAHVKIDSFTSGAVNGALFQEKTDTLNQPFTLKIWLQKGIPDKAQEAFELALKDIAKGFLPLGAATNKGHGIFIGNITKDGVELC